MSEPPRLSVVIAASESPEAVARCLASPGLRAGQGGTEVIVAAARDRIGPRPRPPGVAWIDAEPGSGVPRLRRLGLDLAAGDIVAFTEDSCVLAPGWADAWRRAFARPGPPGATGPVAQGPGASALDWAVFFCEYAPFLGPHPRAEAARLAGNNFAIPRAAASALRPAGELHESEVYRLLAGRGGVPVVVDGALAWHVRRYRLREAIADRLRFGLEFGRLRASGGPAALRPLAILAGPAILLAQAGRLTATLIARGRHGGPFVEALPITLALLTAWSVGEWLGWAFGPRRRAACN